MPDTLVFPIKIICITAGNLFHYQIKFSVNVSDKQMHVVFHQAIGYDFIFLFFFVFYLGTFENLYKATLEDFGIKEYIYQLVKSQLAIIKLVDGLFLRPKWSRHGLINL